MRQSIARATDVPRFGRNSGSGDQQPLPVPGSGGHTWATVGVFKTGVIVAEKLTVASPNTKKVAEINFFMVDVPYCSFKEFLEILG
ncbi:MAG TPA: hypothetical protein VF283_10880, partial [Bryobacteraceae bacterium]